LGVTELQFGLTEGGLRGMKNSGCLRHLAVVIERQLNTYHWVQGQLSTRVLSRECRVWYESGRVSVYHEFFKSEGPTYTKQFEIKQLRSGLVVACVHMFDPHNVLIIVLAPLMWCLQLSRPESMSSNSMKKSTTARVTSISTEDILVRADFSK